MSITELGSSLSTTITIISGIQACGCKQAYSRLVLAGTGVPLTTMARLPYECHLGLGKATRAPRVPPPTWLCK